MVGRKSPNILAGLRSAVFVYVVVLAVGGIIYGVGH